MAPKLWKKAVIYNAPTNETVIRCNCCTSLQYVAKLCYGTYYMFVDHCLKNVHMFGASSAIRVMWQ